MVAQLHDSCLSSYSLLSMYEITWNTAVKTFMNTMMTRFATRNSCCQSSESTAARVRMATNIMI